MENFALLNSLFQYGIELITSLTSLKEEQIYIYPSLISTLLSAVIESAEVANGDATDARNELEMSIAFKLDSTQIETKMKEDAQNFLNG